ncbi:hypothetical protein RJT34_10419 [Clitoria ternatea]|uniref:AP2/ERF domain-containing protein n=1 Tax=Clitoria ternatea TaxID=43366 RepID=A0AAN9K6T9_CLITE
MDMENNNNNQHVMASASCFVNEENNKDNNKLYKGVRKRKWGKWVSEIRLPNSRERIWLGSYDSPEKAARAFDAALYCLRGRHASFNFPDTPCNLQINHSLTPQEIQEVAAKFAKEDPDPLHHNHSQHDNDSKISCANTTVSRNSNESNSAGVQVDHGDDMDWTFLNVFDISNEMVVPVASDYGFYSELHNMHSDSGELLYSTPPPLPSTYQIEADDDPFSHGSFLWNWNF